MCGIAAYIGHKDVKNKLICYLEQLEYRGYDSAGIAVVGQDGELKVTRSVGEVSNLKAKIKSDGSRLGIAHTRWATHGAPCEANAHPHISENGEWAVVHNGIIENCLTIKKEYLSSVDFRSETDTEVIPQLLEKYAVNRSIDGFIDCILRLEGSYAIAALRRNSSEIYLAKNKSPLFVATNGKELTVASDAICFSGEYKEYYELLDGEFARCSENGVEFYGKDGKKIEKQTISCEFSETENSKCGYRHFMLKEIEETGEIISKLADHRYIDRLTKLIENIDLDQIDCVKLVGCGTAYHAALYGADVLARAIKKECTAVVASEFSSTYMNITPKTLLIAVSQSGETADTLAAIRSAHESGALIMTITNVVYSTMARLSDIVVPVFAGKEIAVASTKAYTAQLAILYLISRILSGKDCSEISKLDFSKVNEDEVMSVVEVLKDKEELFILGRGRDYVTALEAALKIKEIAYINANAYMAGELKHGFIALIQPTSVVVVILTQSELIKKTLSAIEEVMARGGKIILITCFDIPVEVANGVMQIIKIPDYGNKINPIAAIVPWQKISYYTAVAKGNNPDKPRNLAKSVTVE